MAHGRSAIVAALIVLLVGCAQVDVEPTTAPSGSTATPTPEPDPVAALLTFDAEAMSIIADDGSILAKFDYFQPATEVVPTLSELLGAPAVEEVGASIGGPPMTTYDWGGLELYDYDSVPSAPYYPDLFFVATAPEVAGIALETIDGVRVGDSGAELEARYPEDSNRVTVAGEPERIDIRLGFVDHPDEECCEMFGGVAVWVVVAPSDGVVSDFRAPSPVST